MCTPDELQSTDAHKALAERMRVALMPHLPGAKVSIGRCERFDSDELAVLYGGFEYAVLNHELAREEVFDAFLKDVIYAFGKSGCGVNPK